MINENIIHDKDNEDILHVKLEYEEAIQLKRDILSSEINLLKIVESVRRYHILRKKELELKLRLHKKIKVVMSIIKDLKKNLPKLSIPKEGEKEEHYEKEKDIHDISLETELQGLQEKLKLIGK